MFSWGVDMAKGISVWLLPEIYNHPAFCRRGHAALLCSSWLKAGLALRWDEVAQSLSRQRWPAVALRDDDSVCLGNKKRPYGGVCRLFSGVRSGAMTFL